MQAELGAGGPAAPMAAPSPLVRLPRPNLDIAGLDLVTPDGRRIASGIDLSIVPGEHIAILGRSGAGKSTLLEAVAALRPYGGKVLAGGRNWPRSTRPRRGWQSPCWRSGQSCSPALSPRACGDSF
jgi:ABC-type transport system involved in cytochrome bd biosynthesis fused ATPase/permease subunit